MKNPYFPNLDNIWTKEQIQKHVSTPSENPASGYVKIYFKSDNKLYKLDSGGTETEIGGSSAVDFSSLQATGMVAFTTHDLASIPSGWLLCDGSAVSRTTYADLFAVCGTKFGIGDGSTTFNLPDLRSKFPRGTPASTEAGGTGGADSVTLSISQIPAHSHSLTEQINSAINVHYFATTGGSRYKTESRNTGSQGGGGSHENRPPFLDLVGIIRT